MSNTNAFQRLSQNLDYAKARQRWWIQVRFNSDVDLMILEKAITGSEIRLVQLEDKFYLEDQRIPDTADIGEAYRLAECVLAQVNGATQVLCRHFKGAQCECMVELLGNGTGRGIAKFEMVVHGISDYPAIEFFLKGGPAPIRAMLSVWKSEKDIQDALFYLGAEGNIWANLYKACEIVEDHVGTSKLLLDKGWCPESEWKRFRRTANHQEAIGLFSRHARSKTVAPTDPMSVTEAKYFVGGLVSSWIQSLAGYDAAQGLPAKA